MSGHSKWATIKRKKASIDAKKGKAFSQLTKEISVAARAGGGDPLGNARLRLLMDKAKEINMPTDNVMRAIKRGTGELPGMHYEPQMYEGYGPYGIAVMVEALTDNKNRTVAELRRIFLGKDGSLGETGSVNWMFTKMGVVRAHGKEITEDALLEALLNYNINDITHDEDMFTITCDSKSVEEVKQTIIKLGLTVESAEVEWVANNTVALGTEQAEKAYELLQELEEHDDVQRVYTNVTS